MANSNTFIATAQLARDPEMRYLDTGKAVTNFSIPLDVGWGDRKDTIWVRVTVWGARAEFCNAHLHKGSTVTVTGKHDVPYVNDEGNVTLQVTADRVDPIDNFGKQDAG